MAKFEETCSSGLPGFDKIINGVLPGDNIVWELDSIEDFVPFVKPYCDHAIKTGNKLIYFRFAKHPPLVEPDSGAEVYRLHAEQGFEQFISEIHTVIDKTGYGQYYVFDSLSDLAYDWCSDRMLGNFFMLCCPYLYDAGALAIFAVLRKFHASHATKPILETAQVVSDVYRYKDRLYVHPTKVQDRYSQTMNMIHLWQGEDFVPVTESGTITEIMGTDPWSRLDEYQNRYGFWARTFAEAERLQQDIQRGLAFHDDIARSIEKLVRMVISRDPRMIQLARKHLNLPDILKIRRRMIGTGLVGGKSVGLLVARAILERSDPRWKVLLEPHDSFFIGSDVFYTFLVRNKVWWLRQKQKNSEDFLAGAKEARSLIKDGKFPGDIEEQFADMLDYFGQSPIIVRSSSLLEDNFGNAFAGKYESIFCANQGPREQRLQEFITAVKRIYASTMSEEALTYRAKRDLLDRDEQMALLVQRVSGAPHGRYFFPQCAGVGFSFNPYAWSEYIEPDAGMLRLVFGLGTRAVDISPEDYTRIVALNDPSRRPETNIDQVRKYAQRIVDVLDLQGNQLTSVDFEELGQQLSDIPIDLFAPRDKEMEKRAAEHGMQSVFSRALTFDDLLGKTTFTQDMRQALSTLEVVYGSPVDVEFTVNFFSGNQYRINFVQCRPLQLKGGGNIVDPVNEIEQRNLVINAFGPVIGQSRLIDIDRIVYVSPELYGKLPIQDRYTIARLIGRLTHADNITHETTIMLLGPGRWGTSSPSLGVPVTYSEINTASVIIEIAAIGDNISPDVSLGTHFFSDLIESDTLYMGYLPYRKENFLCSEFFTGSLNKLIDIVPSAQKWQEIIHVIDTADLNGERVRFYANAIDQKFTCFLEPQNEKDR